jgi:hypothetical protein
MQRTSLAKALEQLSGAGDGGKLLLQRGSLREHDDEAKQALVIPNHEPHSLLHLFGIFCLYARRNFGRVIGCRHFFLQPFERGANEPGLQKGW